MRLFISRFVSVLAAVPLASSQISAKIHVPLDLQPSSEWEIWAMGSSCRLIRTFGSGDDTVTVQLEKAGPAGSLSMLLAGKPMKFPDPRENLEMTLGPANSVRVLKYAGLRGITADKAKLPTLLIPSIDSDIYKDAAAEVAADSQMGLMPTQFADISWLTISEGAKGRKVTLSLEPMKEPLGAIRRCTMTLLRSWGFDPSNRETTPVTLPKSIGDPGKWLTSQDYPAAALRSGTNALINFRLMIDTMGKPVSCHVQTITIGEGFKDITCRALMRHARFNPGLNAAGKPVAAWYENSVRWVIP